MMPPSVNQSNAYSHGDGIAVSTGAKAIEVQHIVKKFGDFTAVNDVSFNVDDGETFGLLGPNGAGKSTLIRMMTTLIPITSGVARISGHDVRRDPDAVRRCIGVIPQALTSEAVRRSGEDAQAAHRRASGPGGPFQMANCAD